MARIKVDLCEITEENTCDEKLSDVIYKLITIKMISQNKLTEEES